MRISGRRADGALYLSMGAGVAVILRGDRVSPPLDESAMDMLGPWARSLDDNTDEAKGIAARLLDRARVSTNVISMGLISMKEKEADEATPVSDVAKEEQVMNLPPEQAAGPPNPFFPADERKKKRGELRDKINGKVRSQKKVSEVLADEDISDDDLYEMAKSLGITDAEHPGAVALVDNPTKFRQLLASTSLSHHLADKQEHPFTYCREHIIPKMEAEGKGPDDPDAFCAWWKSENG